MPSVCLLSVHYRPPGRHRRPPTERPDHDPRPALAHSAPALGPGDDRPDLLRVVHPLSSFGFYANNDGLIYDVTGPFADEASSPAWQAGLREGDQIDL